MYKVLSTRLSILDIASAIDLCDLASLKPSGQSAAINKALSFLLENLRSEGQLPERTLEESITLIEERFAGPRAGAGELRLGINLRAQIANSQAKASESKPRAQAGLTQQMQNLSSFPIPLSANSPTPTGTYGGLPASFTTPLEQHELAGQFEETLAEDIKLYKQLEDENLLDSIMVVEHRRDDEDVELIDPLTMKQEDEGSDV